MGVGIAVPTAKYAIEEVNTTRIADTKRMPKKEKATGYISAIITFVKSFILAVLKFLRLYTPPVKENLWDNVTYRYNQMICMRVRHLHSDKVFVVGNYHMPCMFKLPSVMMAHCALSSQHLQKFAGDDPFIYLGDFNIKPDSTMYRLMTEGTVEKSVRNDHGTLFCVLILFPQNPDYPVSVEGDSWECLIPKPFRSAYRVANGQEPDFTNFAQVQDDPVFCETLDYIFISEHWAVDKVLALPLRGEVVGPFPTEQEPSDHILISANLSFE
jgi:mRNA deadenylase 3'-5' endonuclease subunit Ccr4